MVVVVVVVMMMMMMMMVKRNGIERLVSFTIVSAVYVLSWGGRIGKGWLVSFVELTTISQPI